MAIYEYYRNKFFGTKVCASFVIAGLSFLEIKHDYGIIWSSGCLKSMLAQLFVQQFVQDDNKENMEVPH